MNGNGRGSLARSSARNVHEEVSKTLPTAARGMCRDLLKRGEVQVVQTKKAKQMRLVCCGKDGEIPCAVTNPPLFPPAAGPSKEFLSNFGRDCRAKMLLQNLQVDLRLLCTKA